MAPGLSFAKNRRFGCFAAVTGMVWLLGVVTALSQTPKSAPSCGTEATGHDDSILCAQLKLQDGQLQIDREHTIFTPSESFQKALGIPISAATDILVQDLNNLFRKMPRLYWFGLTNHERDADSTGLLKSAITNDLKHMTKPWSDFREKEQEWHKENPGRRVDAQLLSSFMNAVRSSEMVWGAAFYEEPQPRNNVLAGTLRFRVADPITDLTDETKYSVIVDDNANSGLTRQNIIQVLRPLRGHLWRPSDIREFIDQIVNRRGIEVTTEITDASQNPKGINLKKAARIARIVFSPPVTDASLKDPIDLDRTLYVLLESGLFSKYIGNRGESIKTSDALQQLDFRDLGIAGKEPSFNHHVFARQQAELKQLGFSTGAAKSTVRTDSEGSFVDILVQKDTKVDSAQPKHAPAKSKGLSKGPGPLQTSEKVQSASVVAAAQTSALPSPSSPSNTPAAVRTATPAAEVPQPPATDGTPEPSDPLPPPRAKLNYVYGGFEYNPGQGVKPLGGYERQRLFGPGSLKLEAGSNNDHALGKGNLNLDYLGFSKLHHRIAFSANGSSDFTLNRLLGLTAANERRTGGTARLEGELLRNFHGAQALVFTEARHFTVALNNSVGSLGKSNLNLIDFGSSISWEQSGVAYPWSIRIDPRIRRGLGLAVGEPDFTKFESTGNFHWVSLGPFEFDLSGHVTAASHATPVVELPSFGGVDSVRGFRRDDLLARQFWALQPEIWTGIPGTRFALSGPGAFLRRNARIAVFCDFGNVSDTLAGPPGFKGGPGAGFRLLQNPVILQLDWARPLGNAVTHANWGRFYFNIRFS